MAYENSDPRLPVVFSIAALAICGFIGARFFLISYFAMATTEAEQQRAQQDENEGRSEDGHLRCPSGTQRHLACQRAHEHEQLVAGAMPIDRAMDALAHGDRPAILTPRPSVDFAPMQGWTPMPRHWSPPTISPAAPPDPSAPTMQGGPSSTEASPAPATAPSPAAPPTAPAATAAAPEAH